PASTFTATAWWPAPRCSRAARCTPTRPASLVEALIAGERDPAVLAEMAKGCMRPNRDALAEAMAGRFRQHHAVVARAILDHIDFLDASGPNPRRRYWRAAPP